MQQGVNFYEYFYIVKILRIMFWLEYDLMITVYNYSAIYFSVN